MLTELVLNNFKLFRESTNIPLARINLFTGVNGRGKSSALQPFLLMMQSPAYDRTTDKIYFNGNSVNLGFFEDVKNISNKVQNPIKFEFKFASAVVSYNIEYTIEYVPEEHLVGRIADVKIEGTCDGNTFKYDIKNEGQIISVTNEIGRHTDIFPALFDLFIPSQFQDENLSKVYTSLSFLKVHYISADRIGPKLYYTSQSQKRFNSTGALGEQTISTLFHSKDLIVDQRFIENINSFYNVITEDVDTTIGGQTSFWLDKVFFGAKYAIKEVIGTDLLTFQISTDGSFDFHKPTNVGYGFSYVLPIIVSGLIAQPGEVLIVENPEAHLHPHAQSTVAKFLSLVSLKDVQIIIESHSEHILNGLRIPIFEGVITPDGLSVLYFDKTEKLPFIGIEINDDGGISDWPKNFFDQSTKDFNHLLGL